MARPRPSRRPVGSAARPAVPTQATSARPGLADPSTATPAPPTAAVAVKRDVQAIIGALEAVRGSRVVCYATSDRKGQETQIGNDALPVLYEHLADIGQVERLDLLLYSRGGDTLTGFTLANALREFGTHVAVLVPFRANSCATLIALGADEVVMGPFGELSPIDPSITTPHGPSIEQGGQRTFLPVSVEDVANYFALAQKEAGLREPDHMAQVFSHLSRRVSPLALGAVYRAREQIGMLADKLLSLHMPDQGRREQITKVLTRELLSHDYTLGRREAKSTGIPVVDADSTESDLMWEIYQWIAHEMRLSEPFLPQPGTVTSTRAILASRTRKSAFLSSYSITKTAQTLPNGQRQDVTQADLTSEGWKTT